MHGLEVLTICIIVALVTNCSTKQAIEEQCLKQNIVKINNSSYNCTIRKSTKD